MRKLAQALFMAIVCFSAAGVYASGTEEGSEVVITGDENTTEPSLLLQNDEDTKPKE